MFFVSNLRSSSQAECRRFDPGLPLHKDSAAFITSVNRLQSVLRLCSIHLSARTGLEHIGGYHDTETVEKVAILRARLKLDNSGLIKLAIDDLHRKHFAKRAFGDARSYVQNPTCALFQAPSVPKLGCLALEATCC